MKKNWIAGVGMVFLTVAISSNTAYAAPKTMPDGNTFDAEFYAATYPDVAAVYGNNETLLYQHYLLCGKAEGRLPYAQGAGNGIAVGNNVKTMSDGGKFDATYYAATYPDVVAVLGTNENVLYQHYLMSGKAEGRRPYAEGSVPVTYTTIGFETLTPFASKGSIGYGYKNASYRTDTFGNVYTEVFRGFMSVKDGPSYELYYLNNQYKYMQATVAVNKNWDSVTGGYINDKYIGIIRISGDGRLLWSDEHITSTTHPYTIKVDVSGVKDLKIEMYGEGNMGTHGINPLLGNPVLLKENL